MEAGDILKEQGIDHQHIIYRSFTSPVEEEGQKLTRNYELEGDVARIIGAQLVVDIPEMGYYRGFFGLDLNNENLYLEGHHARNLMTGLETGVNTRYAVIDRESKDGRMRFFYEDKAHSAAPFTPYKVTLYLMLALEKPRG